MIREQRLSSTPGLTMQGMIDDDMFEIDLFEDPEERKSYITMEKLTDLTE
jgi:hypothetical protein